MYTKRIQCRALNRKHLSRFLLVNLLTFLTICQFYGSIVKTAYWAFELSQHASIMHRFQICWLNLCSQEERESAVLSGVSGVHNTLGVTFTEQTNSRDMCAEKGSFKAKCIDGFTWNQLFFLKYLLLWRITCNQRPDAAQAAGRQQLHKTSTQIKKWVCLQHGNFYWNHMLKGRCQNKQQHFVNRVLSDLNLFKYGTLWENRTRLSELSLTCEAIYDKKQCLRTLLLDNGGSDHLIEGIVFAFTGRCNVHGGGADILLLEAGFE